MLVRRFHANNGGLRISKISKLVSLCLFLLVSQSLELKSFAAAEVAQEDENDEEENDEVEVEYDPGNEPPQDICRRNPMWKDLEEDCRSLTGWSPRDYWWNKDTVTTEAFLDSKRSAIDECLVASFAQARLNKTFEWTLYVANG